MILYIVDDSPTETLISFDETADEQTWDPENPILISLSFLTN